MRRLSLYHFLFQLQISDLCILILSLALVQLCGLLLDLLLFLVQLTCHLLMILLDFGLDLFHYFVNFLSGLRPVVQDLWYYILFVCIFLSTRSVLLTGALRYMQLLQGPDLLYQTFERFLLKSIDCVETLVVLPFFHFPMSLFHL